MAFCVTSQPNYAVTCEKKAQSIIVIGESHPFSCLLALLVIARSPRFICSKLVPSFSLMSFQSDDCSFVTMAISIEFPYEEREGERRGKNEGMNERPRDRAGKNDRASGAFKSTVLLPRSSLTIEYED